VPSMVIRQTMLVRESAALVRAWLVREKRHIGSLPGNKPSVMPRAARPVRRHRCVIVCDSPTITPI
jgi:hypothetical protein